MNIKNTIDNMRVNTTIACLQTIASLNKRNLQNLYKGEYQKSIVYLRDNYSIDYLLRTYHIAKEKFFNFIKSAEFTDLQKIQNLVDFDLKF